MRPRCTTHDPSGTGGDEPVVAGPSHAAAIVRASSPPAAGPALVALLCDRSHQLLLALAVEGAPAAALPRVVDFVLGVAEPGGVRSIVLAIVRERLGSYLPRRDAEGLSGLAPRCEAAGVDLLDVLLVGPRGWRSVYDLAAGPGGEDTGPP
ncbi:MAG: hypothetical protein ACLGI2_10900 [Acidimicrobiia bacterium]